jgi:hypothetical protein
MTPADELGSGESRPVFHAHTFVLAPFQRLRQQMTEIHNARAQ